MPSDKQVELFSRMIREDKQLPPGQDANALIEKFKGLSTKEGSRWIERALELPDQGDSGEPVPF